MFFQHYILLNELTYKPITSSILLTFQDLQVLFSCGANKAVEIKKAVQQHQDSFGGIFKSRVAMADVKSWLKANKNRRQGVDN